MSNLKCLYHDRLAPSHIRLMTLLPGEAFSDLRCTLDVMHIDGTIPYEAISYVWGNPDDTEALEVVLSDQAVLQFSITSNLAEALRQVRYDNDVRILWVDSVCINQNNIQERNEQVMIMGQIYRKAQRVLVSLGSGDTAGSAHNARRCMAQLVLASHSHPELLIRSRTRSNSQFQNFGGLEYAHKTEMSEEFDIPFLESPEFVSLKTMFQHPWFHRAWTWQESFLATERIFHYGLWRWPETLMHLTFRILLNLKALSGNDAYTNPELALATPMLVSQKFLRQGQQGDKGSDLLTLLSVRRGSGCKYPSDLVYSLLGAATRCPSIKVDYDLPFQSVFTQVAYDLIHEHHDLSILGLIDGPRKSFDLPSWVPDWRATSADASMCSSNDFTFLKYDTTRNMKPVVKLLSDQRTLAVEGLWIDTITAVRGGQVSEDRFIEELFRRDDSYAPTNEPVEIAFWRTRCRDCNFFEPDEPVQRWDAQTWGRLKEILAGADSTPDGRGRYAAMLAVIASTNNDKVLFKTKQGCMGFGCSSVREGDVVALLFGAQYPMVLRPSGVDQGYLVIGESYIHGLMDGQGIDGIEGLSERDASIVRQDFVKFCFVSRSLTFLLV